MNIYLIEAYVREANAIGIFIPMVIVMSSETPPTDEEAIAFLNTEGFEVNGILSIDEVKEI